MGSGIIRNWLFLFSISLALHAQAQPVQQVVDVASRPGVTQRMLVLTPPSPKGAVILLAGGHGGLQLQADGSMLWGKGNFLVRTRNMFARQGLMVAVVDAPSDRQGPPFLSNFRQTPEHVADIKAAISWLRTHANVPVWLVGTSRGTQSAAHAAIELAGPGGPDGMVLTSTILTENLGRPVPGMALDKVRIPVLVVHHEQDGCSHCRFNDVPLLMDKLVNAPRKQLLAFKGGVSEGDPCEAMAYHGFNGQEREVVGQTVTWILAR
jgi:dienelactone hydrolase